VSTAALKVEDLSVWYGTGADRRPVVDKVSFSVAPGEAGGLVGESGCGKTMTAMAILGLLPASGVQTSAASIEVAGKDISGLSAAMRRKVLGNDIAMVFQQPGSALDPVFTIGQQISAIYRRHNPEGSKQVRQNMLQALSSVGFDRAEEIANAYPHQLSGGMRQLAMIAMATVCRPAVIIADEPTTALDGNARAHILQQLKQLQELHKTALLLISHDLNVVRQICQKVMVMYCGRLIEKSICQALFAQARHPYTAGLLACIPRIGETRPPQLDSIPGQVPRQGKLPPGCHFAPRCPRAEARCRESVPDLEPPGGHAVACFRPLP
jgi:oligopeptide/dipeptide ABC transporter ATP-binding protein